MNVSSESVGPVLPVLDVQVALAHYRALGFEARAHGDTMLRPAYGSVSWGSVELQLARVEALNPETSTSAAYVYVNDADDLHARWRAADVAGRLTPPEDTPYGLREFAHVDVDGNLLRVGSPLKR